MTTVGERIHEWRRKAGLTQAVLAKQCGVSAVSVIAWERGHSKPDRHAVVLANALGVNLHWLLTGEGQPRRGFVVDGPGALRAEAAPAGQAAAPAAESSIIKDAMEEVLKTGPVERLIAKLPRAANPWMPLVGDAAADTGEGRVYDAEGEPGRFAKMEGDDLRVITARGISAEEFAREGQQVVLDASVRNVPVGELCVVYCRDGSLRIKRKYRDVSGQRCYQSINREFPMFRAAPKDVIAEFPVRGVFTHLREKSPVQTVDEGFPT